MLDHNILVPIHIALAALATLAWAACMLTALGRYRVFRQRADLWWALAFLCLVGVGVGRLLGRWYLQAELSNLPYDLQSRPPIDVGPLVNALTLFDFPTYIAFTLAGLLALIAYRRRRDVFDD